MSQVLNVKRHKLDQLAKFMGHDIRVHKQFYRLPVDVVETARVVRVLMAFRNGFTSPDESIIDSKLPGLTSLMANIPNSRERDGFQNAWVSGPSRVTLGTQTCSSR